MKHENTCPECRNVCVEYPLRDFALRDIIPAVYFGLGQEMPNYESFDDAVFVTIYAMLDECNEQMLTDSQLKAFWSPMVAEVRRMRGVPAAVNVEVDVGTVADAGESDWESVTVDDSEGNGGGAGNVQDGEYAQDAG